MVFTSGLQLLRSGTALVERSADTIARTAVPPDPAADGGGTDALPGAVVDLVYGRFVFDLGVVVIRAGREDERHLLDLFA